MKRQRGFGIELYLIAALALGAVLTGTYFYGRHDGATLERATWVKRDNDALRQANADLDEAHRKLRDQERQSAERLAQVSGEYQKELTDVRLQTRTRTAAVDRGDLRLRDPAASHQACADRAGEARTTAGGRDGPATGELSATASRFLLELTGEADEVAKQLAGCQKALTADRR